METRWMHTISADFPALVEASKKTCVIPMGCVEKHGPHLPVGTDVLEAAKIAYMASQLETVCIFPEFMFGDVPGKVPYSLHQGSIAIPLETQMLLLEQLCIQIYDNGFEKILVYNCHGGNSFWLPAFARNLANKGHNFSFGIATVELPVPHKAAELLEKEGSGAIPELTKEDEELLIKYHKENMLLGHACMSETAFIMGTAPESIKLDRLGTESGEDQHVADKLNEAKIHVESGGWCFNFPNAYKGTDPVGCNERIGTASLRMESERLAKVFKVFKEDTIMPEWREKTKWK